MAKKYLLIGNSYEAENLADFFRRYNPPVHRLFYRLYRKLGEIDRPILATYAIFIISAFGHDLLVLGIQKAADFEYFRMGCWTLAGLIIGTQVAVDKFRIKNKAKKYLGQELDSLLKRYGSQNPQELISRFSSNLSSDRIKELSFYFSDYKKHREKILDELFKDTKKGFLQVMRERREKGRKSKIPKPFKAVVYFTYTLALVFLCNYILKQL